MVHNFKGLYTGIFYFIIFIIIPWSSTYCAEIVDESSTLQVNVTKASLGEYCGNDTCGTNQYCDRNLTCSCYPGYKVYKNECVLFSGENGKCVHNIDCEVRLVCINGICRKPNLNKEFAVLAKVCLGITVTTLIIAMFSSLIKCIIRYDNSPAFGRQSVASSVVASPPFSRNVHQPTLNELLDEKPPSYEECIRSSGPPPYIISNQNASLETPIQPTNLTNVNPQNELPLNVQNLNQKINSK